MRRLPLILVVLALVAAGCAGSDSESEQPGPVQDTTPAEPLTSETFSKDDLAEIALQPGDAPAGMRYTKVDSGQKTLLDAGIITDDQVTEVRGFGYRAMYDAIFDATSTDVRLASRLWLFAEPEGAEDWLAKTEEDAANALFQPISAPSLGDGGSWAGRGAVGADVITHAFRISNVVVVTTYSTQQEQLSESAALAAAQLASERILEH